MFLCPSSVVLFSDVCCLMLLSHDCVRPLFEMMRLLKVLCTLDGLGLKPSVVSKFSQFYPFSH